MTKTVLVTGANGFLASRFLTYISRCEKKSTRVYGIVRNSEKVRPGLELQTCDLSKKDEVESLFQKTQPNQIYHLAGCFTNDIAIDFPSNVKAAANIFDAARICSEKRPRILIIGSAAEYGPIQCKSKRIKESHALNPTSVYGLTKVMQSRLAAYYCQQYDLKIVIARPFNMIGAGLSRNLFMGSFLHKASLYKKGLANNIDLKNLNSARDFIDVNDVIRALHVIMEKGKAGETYNIGSGYCIELEIMIQRLLELLDIPTDALCSENSDYDYEFSYCASIEKLSKLGWAAEISIDQALLGAVSKHVG